jgi:hypothetical protein
MKYIFAVMSATFTLFLSAQAQVGPNIDELARELSNPGAANATMNFKFEYRTFRGELSGAGDQDSLTVTFQPVLPFVLPNGNNLIFRPAFPYIVGQPSFDSVTGSFTETSNFGDIPMMFSILGKRGAGYWGLESSDRFRLAARFPAKTGYLVQAFWP